MKRGVLGAVALLLLGLGVPAEAASTSASVTGVNGVLYDDCAVAHPYRYTMADPPPDAYWALDVVLVGPDGREADRDYVEQPGPSGTSAFDWVCPPDRPGTYTIRATLEWGPDKDHPDVSSQRLPDARFTLRKPRTRTALSVSTHRPAYGQRVRYRIRTWDERPDGYHPTAFAWVFLQKRVDGRWVRIRNSRTLTHDTGRVSLRLRYRYHHKRMRLRAVTEPTDVWARSTSAPVRLW